DDLPEGRTDAEQYFPDSVADSDGGSARDRASWLSLRSCGWLMSEYSSGGATWRKVLARTRLELLPRRTGRRSGWSLGVPVIALAAGLLFTTSATNASGDTPLREDRRLEVADLIEEREERVAEAEAILAPLEEEVAALTEQLAGSD